MSAESGRWSLDWSRLSRADRMVLASAGAFLIWSFVPVWYRFLPGGILTPGFETTIDAWHGVTVVCGLAAVVAVAWVLMRMAAIDVRIPLPPGVVDLGLAVVAELFALIGLAARPAFFSATWGLFAGIGLGIPWCYAAVLRLFQPPADARVADEGQASEDPTVTGRRRLRKQGR
jgi:hypothetical protein